MQLPYGTAFSSALQEKRKVLEALRSGITKIKGIYEILMFPSVTYAIICDIVRGNITDSNGKRQQVHGKDYITLHE